MKERKYKKRPELFVKSGVKWRWKKTGGEKEAAQQIVKPNAKNRAEGWRGRDK